MIYVAQAQSIEGALKESRSVFERIGESLFSGQSIITLLVSLTVALLLGRLVAAVLRRVTKIIGARADKTENLDTVNRLRRYETLIVLSIAAIRTLLVILAIYFWWVFTHDNQQSTAILGAGAMLTIILSGALFNTLRDIASGSAMMAEQWYGVGDHISIEPFPDTQGVVERVTLRSTRIRKVTGEVFWVNNKDIAGVSVTPKGVRTVAIELFTKDLQRAEELVEITNTRLPQGSLAVVSPLTIMTKAPIGERLWHITALSEVAPGREWMLDKFAIDVLKELDEKDPVLAHDPISRYADSEAERRFGRAIHNARKSRVRRQPTVMARVEKAARQRKAKSQAKHRAKSDTPNS